MATTKRPTASNGSNGKAKTLVEPVVQVISPPVVAPAGARPISDDLPDVIMLPPRITFADSPVEQLGAVCAALNMSRDLDKRLELLTAEDMRGHSAVRVKAPRAALVRSGNNPLVTLVAEVAGHMGQTRNLSLRPIASYYTDVPGQLLRPPHRAEHELSDEGRARAIQVFDGLSDDEAHGLFSPPPSIDSFRLTTAERVEVEGCLYRLPNNNAVLWVKDHKGLLWPCCVMRREAYRRHVEEPMTEGEKMEAWRTIQNARAY